MNMKKDRYIMKHYKIKFTGEHPKADRENFSGGCYNIGKDDTIILEKKKSIIIAAKSKKTGSSDLYLVECG